MARFCPNEGQTTQEYLEEDGCMEEAEYSRALMASGEIDGFGNSAVLCALP